MINSFDARTILTVSSLGSWPLWLCLLSSPDVIILRVTNMYNHQIDNELINDYSVLYSLLYYILPTVFLI